MLAKVVERFEVHSKDGGDDEDMQVRAKDQEPNSIHRVIGV